MFSLIEASGYRCLRHVREPLDSFHVLVGPNASGKTTFLDVVSFLGRLVSDGLEAAVSERTHNFQDLVWKRDGTEFELALEAPIPSGLIAVLGRPEGDVVRYEVRVGIHPETEEVSILAEKVVLRENTEPSESEQPELFPRETCRPESLLIARSTKRTRTVIDKQPDGHDNFHGETGDGWDHTFKLGPRKSALGNLPEDETRFPVSTWLKGFLTNGIQRLTLNSLQLRQASPPGQVRGFKPDGSNLAWVVRKLRTSRPDSYELWIEHLRTALPDLVSVDTIVREDDKHCYLRLAYANGVQVPSWVASDGTLRLLALTLPAYLSDFRGLYLVEEPENGIHPRAIETMYQSLSSVYDAQVLMATHSPVMLSIARLESILCFAKTAGGSTDVIRGSQHPLLKDWRGETTLGSLFAGGVLG